MEKHDGSDRVAGIALVGATLLAILAMAHHPVSHGSGAELTNSIARLATLNRFVHGTLIGLLVTILFALSAYARRRGLDRPLALAGLIFYSAGSFLMLIPPVINGFAIPAIAEHALSAGGAGQAQAAAEIVAPFLIGIAVAKIAAVLMSLGIGFWSIGLCHDRGFTRGAGALGLAVAVATAGALLTGAVQLTAGGMLAILLGWAAWFLAIGFVMIRGAEFVRS
jgi:hypothetical protein